MGIETLSLEYVLIKGGETASVTGGTVCPSVTFAVGSFKRPLQFFCSSWRAPAPAEAGEAVSFLTRNVSDLSQAAKHRLRCLTYCDLGGNVQLVAR